MILPVGDSSACNGPRIAPLFPLSNVFLFPRCVRQLHVFEPRYRQMIEDLLDGQGRLVIGTLLDHGEDGLDGSPPGSPPVFPVAGYGEIVHHERIEDGRFWIWLLGLGRVRIREVESARLYRQVQILPLEETAVPEPYERKLRKTLRAAIHERCNGATKIPNEASLSCLTDLLLLRLELPQSAMLPLFGELDVARRAEGALAEHVRRPIPPATPEPHG